MRAVYYIYDFVAVTNYSDVKNYWYIIDSILYNVLRYLELRPSTIIDTVLDIEEAIK